MVRSGIDRGRSDLWLYAPLSEYEVPSEAAADALRGFRRIWKSVRKLAKAPANRVPAEGTREQLSPEELADLVPRFEVDAAARALAAALGDWPGKGAERSPTRVVVGPPGAYTKAVVESLARSEGWAVIQPPPRAELVAEKSAIASSLEALGSESGVGVIVDLGRWLLRNELALPLVRNLLAKLHGRQAPLLVGCNSWAWSFLNSTLAVGDLLGEPLALAPLDGNRLAAWLGAPLRSRGLVCRPGGDAEKVVFPAPRESESAGELDQADASPVLVELASAARGNPGVALELWRRCLRRTRDDTQSAAQDGDDERILSAAPLKQSEIIVPAGFVAAHRFILHAVLLHGGLERDLLPEVVPISRHEAARQVCDLERQSLVVASDGDLTVPLASYPAVREHLQGEGLLVDDF